MPQFQTLQPNPGFGQQFGQALGAGLGQGFQSTVSQYFEQKKNKSQLEGLRPVFKELGFEEEGIDALVNSGLDPKAAASIAGQMGQQLAKENAAMQKQKMVEEKVAREESEKQKELNTLKSNIKWLRDHNEYTGTTLFGKGKFAGKGVGPLFNKEGFKVRKEFDKRGFFLADKAYTHLNKGTVSNVKFEAIKDDLAPNSKFTEAENEARTNALEAMWGLDQDTSPEEFERFIDEQKDKIAQVHQEAKGNVGGPERPQFNLKPGESTESLPKASEVPVGAIFKNGNKRYRSDGKTWKEIK